MSPPRHISYSLLLPTTGLQVNTSSKFSEAIDYYRSPCPHLTNISFSSTTYYRSTGQHVVKALRIILYYRSPCHHLAIYLNLFYYLLQVYRSTRCQNPQNHTNTTSHHVPTLPYISFSNTTYHRSTGQHVVKTLRINPLLQVPMSPPRHISSSTTTNYYRSTGQHVVKALRIILYYRSTCPHLAIYFILYYYLPQVYRSTRRQNPQRHTITKGPQVPTSPYISFSTTTYHRSTGQHVVKTPRINPLLHLNMSPPRHISHSLLLPTTGLQVNTSSNPSEAYYYYRSPCPYLTMYLILNYYLLQVYRSTRRQAPQKHTSTTGHHVTTSPCISFSTTTYHRSTHRQNPHKHTITTGHHVTTSPCISFSTTTYHRSTRRQNPHKHTITTGQHVPTSPYISFSTTTYYRSTGQHVVKPLRSILLLQVNMSPPRHISHSLLLPTTGLQVNTSSKPSESIH